MDALLKSLVLIGATLLVGGGVFVRWTAREARDGPRGASLLRAVAVGVALGFVLVTIGSLGTVAEIVTRITRGAFDPALFLDYLATTRHGRLTSLRVVLALLTGLWGVALLLRSSAGHALFALSAGAFLATISLVSHSATMSGVGMNTAGINGAGFASDFVHLVATTMWAGPLAYLAFLPLWRSPSELVPAVRRISSAGLAAVTLLAATGGYMATLHLTDVRELEEAAYGRALSAKLVLVLAIVLLAALNRWLFVPWLERRSDSLPLRRAVRVESFLLAGVLVATGLLSTTEPPHEHPDHAPGAVAGEHTHEPRVAATRPPNRLEFQAGTLVVAAGDTSGLLVRLEGDLPGGLALEAISPAGEFGPLRRADDGAPVDGLELAPDAPLLVALPTGDSSVDPTAGAGVWRLVGEFGEEAFTLPITVARGTTEDGLEAELVLIPSPALSGGGQTNAYVRMTRGGVPVAAAVSIATEMPGMEHAETVRSLSAPPRAEGEGAARSTRLAFPMVGEWHVTLSTRDDTVVVIVEMLDE